MLEDSLLSWAQSKLLSPRDPGPATCTGQEVSQVSEKKLSPSGSLTHPGQETSIMAHLVRADESGPLDFLAWHFPLDTSARHHKGLPGSPTPILRARLGSSGGNPTQ